VLATHAVVCVLGVLCWLLTPHWVFAIYLVAAAVLVLFASFVHWVFFQLRSIDATCVLPSLFCFPPAGPAIMCFLAAGQAALEWKPRLAVLRPGHLELYSEAGELQGVILLDGTCRVRLSFASSTQFVLASPGCVPRTLKQAIADACALFAADRKSRQLRLWAGDWLDCRDWVERLEHVIELCMQGTQGGFSPARPHTPATPLLDGEEYFAAVHDALESAREQVFIAGWMLNPELFLLRPRACGRAVVLGAASPLDAVVEVDCAMACGSYNVVLRGEAALATAAEGAALMTWTLKGRRRCGDGGDWVVLDARCGVNVADAFGDEGFACFACARGELECDAFALQWGGQDEGWEDAGVVARVACVVVMDQNAHTDGDFARMKRSRLDRVLARCVQRGVSVHVLLWREVDFVGLVNASRAAKRKLEAIGAHVARHAPPGRLLESVRHAGALCRRDPGLTYFSHHEKLVVVDQEVAFVGGIDLAFGRFDCALHRAVDDSRARWPGCDFVNIYNADLTAAQCARPFADPLEARPDTRAPWHDVGVRVEGAAACDVARHVIGRWNAERSRGKPLLVPKFALGGRRRSGASATCRIVRSVALWSGPFSHAESSILDSTLRMIDGARALVYAENQFFSSSLANGYIVSNKVAEAIARRVTRAIVERDSTLRVVVVLPSVPAFEGGADSTNGRAVMFWTLSTIRALVARVSKDAGRPPSRRELGFYSLYREGGTPIYVHSKVLVVDDETCLVGSANWNDRSLLGKRDSEVGVVLEGGGVARELRTRLFMEHCLGDALEDWDAAAGHNTGALAAGGAGMRGHVVWFDEERAGGLPGCCQAEGLLPVENWS